MLRYLLLLSFFITSSAFAQTGLRWDQDTVTLSQRGCAMLPDTLRTGFTNTSGSAIELIDLSGLSTRWEIVNEASLLRTIQPNEHVDVALYYKAGPGSGMTNYPLYLQTSEGTADTVRVVTDIRVAGLGTKYHDTVTFEDYSFPLGTMNSWIVYRATTGNLPFVIKDYWIEADPEVSVSWPFRRDSVRGEIRLEFSLTANRPDTFQATVFFRGTECDSLYTNTVIFTTKARDENRVHWDRNFALLYASDCQSRASAEVVLMNTGQLDDVVESVQITGDGAKYFNIVSTDPPNKLQNFTFAPSSWETGYRYYIEFDPNGEVVGPEAKLVVQTVDGVRDTLTLRSSVNVGHLRAADTTSVKFGTLLLDSTRTIYPELINTGSGPFKVTSVQLPPNVTLSGLAADTVIEARSYHKFSASVSGDWAGDLSLPIIVNGDGCDRSDTIRLRGTVESPQSVRNFTKSEVRVSVNGKLLRVQHNSSSVLPYTVFDITSKVVVSGRIGNAGVIDLNGRPAGVYVLRLEENGSPSITKLRLE